MAIIPNFAENAENQTGTEIAAAKKEAPPRYTNNKPEKKEK